MIEQLAARVFAIRNCAHVAHWKTTSYSAHVALQKLYDKLPDKIDNIVEAYMGLFGPIGAVGSFDLSSDDVAICIDDELEWLDTHRAKIALGSTLIENLLDELMQLYSSTRYKLVTFK